MRLLGRSQTNLHGRPHEGHLAAGGDRTTSGPFGRGALVVSMVRPGVIGAAVGCLVLTGCSGGQDGVTLDDVLDSSLVGSSAEASESAAVEPRTTTDQESDNLAWQLPEPPGDVFDVGGHDMHLYCVGDGEPTVLLETSQGDPALNYRPLQEELARTTRVCSYDRSGLGWSQPGPSPRTGKQNVSELVALLNTAGESGPYVLAGHGSGGLLALLFARERPQDVAGVVLIDSSHPEEYEVLQTQLPSMITAEDVQMNQLLDAAERVTKGELGPLDAQDLAPSSLPPNLQEQWGALVAQPHSLRTTAAEWDAYPDTSRQVTAAGPLGDIPLIVIAAGRGPAASMPVQDRETLGLTTDDINAHETLWQEFQRDLGQSPAEWWALR